LSAGRSVESRFSVMPATPCCPSWRRVPHSPSKMARHWWPACSSTARPTSPRRCAATRRCACRGRRDCRSCRAPTRRGSTCPTVQRSRRAMRRWRRAATGPFQRSAGFTRTTPRRPRRQRHESTRCRPSSFPHFLTRPLCRPTDASRSGRAARRRAGDRARQGLRGPPRALRPRRPRPPAYPTEVWINPPNTPCARRPGQSCLSTWTPQRSLALIAAPRGRADASE
jgi:hypothetical protein